MKFSVSKYINYLKYITDRVYKIFHDLWESLENYKAAIFTFLKLEMLKGKFTGNTVFLQVYSFDVGGLEELVLSLAMNIEKKSSYKVIIIVNDHKYGYTGKKAARLGITTIITGNSPAVLRKAVGIFRPVAVNMHYSLFGIEIYEENNIPLIYSIQNVYMWVNDDVISERKKSYKHVGQFIAVSGFVKDFFSQKFEIPPEKIICISNGIDLPGPDAIIPYQRELLGLSNGDFIFINVASFNYFKFHILMVRAMAVLKDKYPEFKMIFVANILNRGCYNYIMNKIKSYGLTNIIVLPYQPKEKVFSLLTMADCYVMPSLIEGWSISIATAMYCRLPLILSDTGSAREILEKHDIGLLIPNAYPDFNTISYAELSRDYFTDSHLTNLDELCNAMIEIYTNAPSWKEKAKKSRMIIENETNSAIMSEQYIKVINAVRN